jgi:uncharacterized protein (DUF885 family)
MTTAQTFYDRIDRWIERINSQNPVVATQLGDHRYDDRLGTLALSDLEDQNRELRHDLDEIEAMDIEGWSDAEQIDRILTIQLMKQLVRGFEKIEAHRRDPGQALNAATGGVMLLIIKDFAPLEERLRSALGRVREVPRILREGRESLIPERVPKVWAQTAIEQGRMAPMLFRALLPSLAQTAAPGLVEELGRAGESAAAAAEKYLEYVETEVLPHAAGDFAVGRALFDEMLREDHMVDYDADRLLKIGWQQFEATKQLLADIARQIDPTKDARQLLEEAKADHPTADGLLDAYRQAMAASRRFVVEHEVATIPEEESLTIVETPPYLRPILPYAAYMQPGILEDKQDGLFFVTPVDPKASPEEQEQKLKGHYRAKLPITTLHEGYPGHHLQLTWSNRTSTKPRRLGAFLSSLFPEGWAFYCEELMERLGYIDRPIQRLGRLSDQLWRAARIILDVSLHTGGMTVEEGIAFLVEQCQLEPANAAAEVYRYTASPTQPQSYLMGKLQILEIVEALKAARPDAGMRELHDTILAAGSLPPRLMRRALLGGE